MFDSEGDQQRAQSELIGIVLLFALVITVSLTVVVVGGSALGDMQSLTTTESAEISMTEFQSKVAQMDADSTAVQQVSFAESRGGQAPISDASGASMQAGNEGDVTVDESAGSIDINITRSNGSVVVDPAPIALGSVVYERDGERVAYQSGGVFRQNTGADESSMVSPPNFQYQYRNGVPTLSLPITQVNGSGSGGDLSLKKSTSERIFPTSGASGVSNPIEPGHKVKISIKSEYYRAWGELFEQQTEANVDYPPSRDNVVTLTLNGPPARTGTLSSAVRFGAGGTISNIVITDSYASDSGYPPNHSFNYTAIDSGTSDDPYQKEGDLLADGNLEVDNDIIIGGEVSVTGYIKTQGSTVIHGPARAGAGDSLVRADAVLHDVFSTEGKLKTTTNSNVKYGDDVIVEGGFYDAFDPKYVGGSIYVHSPVGVSAAFHPDEIGGSLHVDGDTNLDTYDTISIDGDIYSSESVIIGDNVHFDGSDQVIHAEGDVTVKRGTYSVDIVSNGQVDIQSGATINGEVDAESRTGGGSVNNDETYGASAQDPTAPTLRDAPTPTPPSLDPESSATPIINHRNLADPSNNNNTSSPISTIEGGSCSNCELTAGSYSLDGLELNSGQKLTLNTNGGDIELYIDGGFRVNGEIEVEGPNQVRVYQDTAATVEFDGQANIYTPNDNANQIWWYLWPRDSGTTVEMRQSPGPKVTGVLYGPGVGSNGAILSTAHSPEIFGAVVLDMGAVDQYPTIHFDESLSGGSSQSIGGDAGNVAFLQVTQSEVSVSD